LKQVVCQLFGEETIKALGSLSGQSTNKVVQYTILIQHKGSELMMTEFEVLSHITKTGEPPEGIAEKKCCSA
jgi:hypothetical protein